MIEFSAQNRGCICAPLEATKGEVVVSHDENTRGVGLKKMICFFWVQKADVEIAMNRAF